MKLRNQKLFNEREAIKNIQEDKNENRIARSHKKGERGLNRSKIYQKDAICKKLRGAIFDGEEECQRTRMRGSLRVI